MHNTQACDTVIQLDQHESALASKFSEASSIRMFPDNDFWVTLYQQEGPFKEDETDEAYSTLTYGKDEIHPGFRRKLRRNEINQLLKNKL